MVNTTRQLDIIINITSLVGGVAVLVHLTVLCFGDRWFERRCKQHWPAAYRMRLAFGGPRHEPHSRSVDVVDSGSRTTSDCGTGRDESLKMSSRYAHHVYVVVPLLCGVTRNVSSTRFYFVLTALCLVNLRNAGAIKRDFIALCNDVLTFA